MAGADRVELRRAGRQVGLDGHWRAVLSGDERRVHGLRDPVGAGEVENERERHPADQDRLSPDLVRPPAEEDVERRADHRHDEDQQVLGRAGHSERLFQEDLHVEEGEVPDRALGEHDPEEGDQHPLQVLAAAECFAKRPLGHVLVLDKLRELGAFGELEPHPQRHAEQHDRNQERDPPAPRAECPFAHPAASDENDDHCSEQPEGRGRLDPAGRASPLLGRRMFSDVDCGAAIFAAESNSLRDPKQDEEGGSERSSLGIGRQKPDQECRSAHQADRGQERALAPQPVADDSEDQRAEGAEGEAGGEQAECGDERGRWVESGEEGLADDRREASEDEKVVPLERRPGRRSDDNASHRPGLMLLFSYACHQHVPPWRKG